MTEQQFKELFDKDFDQLTDKEKVLVEFEVIIYEDKLFEFLNDLEDFMNTRFYSLSDKQKQKIYDSKRGFFSWFKRNFPFNLDYYLYLKDEEVECLFECLICDTRLHSN